MDTERRLTINDLDDRGCFNMLYAMLKYMSKEFRCVYRKHITNPTDKKFLKKYDKIKEEFTSDWFTELTHLDGRAVVDELEEIVCDEICSCA